MTPQSEPRALLRNGILAALARAGRAGMSVRNLNEWAALFGHRWAKENDIADALQYLCDKQLATNIERTISPEIEMYRCTAAGTDYLATIGLDA